MDVAGNPRPRVRPSSEWAARHLPFGHGETLARLLLPVDRSRMPREQAWHPSRGSPNNFAFTLMACDIDSSVQEKPIRRLKAQ